MYNNRIRNIEGERHEILLLLIGRAESSDAIVQVESREIMSGAEVNEISGKSTYTNQIAIEIPANTSCGQH